MANEEHLQILQQGASAWNAWREENQDAWLDFTAAKLGEANFSGMNLSGADFAEADLSGADLSGARLGRAKLIQANLFGAKLIDADLREANLEKANLSSAKLSGADLAEANLGGVDLNNADLSEANLSWTNLSRAELRKAKLTRGNLSWAKLVNAQLDRADLSGANLRNAALRHAKLSVATLTGVELSRANLSKADLWAVNLSGVNLSGENFAGANLSGANLSGANFNGTKLTSVVWGSTGLDLAYLGESTDVLDNESIHGVPWHRVFIGPPESFEPDDYTEDKPYWLTRRDDEPLVHALHRLLGDQLGMGDDVTIEFSRSVWRELHLSEIGLREALGHDAFKVEKDDERLAVTFKNREDVAIGIEALMIHMAALETAERGRVGQMTYRPQDGEFILMEREDLV